MDQISKLLAITLGAILANNFIFSQFLGICPFLGVSKKLDSAVGMSLAVTFVMVMATAATWPIYKLILCPEGMENTSRRYTYDKVKAMIERQQEKYGWEFLFLGANIDAAQEAARFGIRADRAANYHADGVGTGVIYKAVSEAVCQVRSCATPLSSDWKQKIDEDFKGRKR